MCPAGLFGALQSAMVMNMVPDHLRGRALGLLTMAIGAGPFGMAMLGELAEAFGAANALWYVNVRSILFPLLFPPFCGALTPCCRDAM